MSEKEKAEPTTPSELLPTDELPQQTGKEVHVPYWETPAPPPPGQEIHPRQHIPPVPAGEEVPDDAPSPPVELE
ncbi:MAG TPA: hypothetical protein VF546_11000 [Pyrinomonadaceae bacterium]